MHGHLASASIAFAAGSSRLITPLSLIVNRIALA